MGESTGSGTAFVVGKEYKVANGRTVFGHYSHVHGYQPISDAFKLIFVCTGIKNDAIKFELRSPDSKEPLSFLGKIIYFEAELDQAQYFEEFVITR